MNLRTHKRRAAAGLERRFAPIRSANPWVNGLRPISVGWTLYRGEWHPIAEVGPMRPRSEPLFPDRVTQRFRPIAP